MFKQFLSQVTGMDIYLIFSLFLFLVFFLLVGVWLWKANKDHIERMKNLPVND